MKYEGRNYTWQVKGAKAATDRARIQVGVVVP
jgi:hypothetical protein